MKRIKQSVFLSTFMSTAALTAALLALAMPSAMATDQEPSFDEQVRDAQPSAGPVHQLRDGVYSPIEAVVFAAQAAPGSVEGTFGFTVRNVGQGRNGVIYLNSELNYREQMNLSIQMSQRAASFLQRTYGRDWVNEVVGKNIEVTGEAKRIPIYFYYQNNVRSNMYYYQTHVVVERPDQFVILEE